MTAFTISITNSCEETPFVLCLARLHMPFPVSIPQATISMEEGKIVRWFKTEGEMVAKDDLLFEVETDKAVVEVPAPADGVLLRVLTAEGVVRVNEVVAWIGEPGENPDPVAVSAPAAPIVPSSVSPQSTIPSQRVSASPAARRRARELGVDLRTVKGTSQGGRITEEDVESVAQARPAPGARKGIAQQLSLAWREVPHIHIGRELDASGLVAARRRHPGLSFTDFFLYAIAKALPRFPQLLQVWHGEEVRQAAEIDICLAVETPKGVLTPVIRSADKLSLDEVRQLEMQITEAARTGRVRLADLQGAFTLTNLGMFGADFFTPIINYPQTAILATGRVQQRPLIVSEIVGVGWRVWVNLAVDHRVTDGACAARFLEELQRVLNQLANEAEVRGQS